LGRLSQFKSSEEALELILKYTEPGVPQALRLAAIRGSGHYLHRPEQAQRRAHSGSAGYHRQRELFPDPDIGCGRVEGPWKRPGPWAILQSLADHTPDGRVRRRAQEAVQKVQKAIGKDQAVEKLRNRKLLGSVLKPTENLDFSYERMRL
jgi:aminopeptidase N